MAKNQVNGRNNSRSSLLDCGRRLRYRFGRFCAHLITDLCCTRRKKKRDAQEKDEIDETVISQVEKKAVEEIRENKGAEGDFEHLANSTEDDRDENKPQTVENSSNEEGNDEMEEQTSVISAESFSSEISVETVVRANATENDDSSDTERVDADKEKLEAVETFSNEEENDKMEEKIFAILAESFSSEISVETVVRANATESEDSSDTERVDADKEKLQAVENSYTEEGNNELEEKISIITAESFSSELSIETVVMDSSIEYGDWPATERDNGDEDKPHTVENFSNEKRGDKGEEKVSATLTNSFSSEIRNQLETKSVADGECFTKEINSELEMKSMSDSDIDTEDRKMYCEVLPWTESDESIETGNMYAHMDNKSNEACTINDTLGGRDQAAEDFLKCLYSPNIGQMIWEQDEFCRNVLRMREKKEEKPRKGKNFKKLKSLFKTKRHS